MPTAVSTPVEQRLVSEERAVPRLRGLDLRSWLGFVLVCATLVTYFPVRHNDFIAMDDPYYVTENAEVQRGLTPQSVVWAFTSTKAAAYWHPITWLSHMADCHFFGLNPGAHHLSNLLIHTLNVLLLFLLLSRITGAVWRAALVAALFALHPLNVESVAWIAERKNLLSTFFLLVTIWAYVTYVRRPSLRNYLTMVVVFALGLMSKPMLVTLPFLLLLLDYWPLGRTKLLTVPSEAQDGTSLERRDLNTLVREKLPLLAMSVASSIITLKTQAPAIASLQSISASARISHSLFSYFNYLLALFWPVKLAAFYPYERSIPRLQIAMSVAMLVSISLTAIWKIRRYPYLALGWFWFLGSLVPVIGIVQSGMQARADRFVYVPFIGLFVTLSWGSGELVRARPHLRLVIGVACTAALLFFAADTRKQIAYWRDSETLFTRALEVTKDNAMAHMIIGSLLNEKGDHDGALAHSLAAMKIEPRNGSIYYRIGRMELLRGDTDQADYYFRRALLFSNSEQTLGMVHDRLGYLLQTKGKWQQAEDEYKEAIRLDPEQSYYSRLNLAVVLTKQGRYEDAAGQYASLIKDAPSEPSLYFLLGEAREQQGRLRDAATDFRRTLELQPGYAPAQIQLDLIAKKDPKALEPDPSRKTAPL